MDTLLRWLKSQHHGTRTFRALKEKVDTLGAEDSQNRAIYRLVSTPIESYLAVFEDELVDTPTADRAFHRAFDLVSKANSALYAEPTERLRLMNDLAGASLY
jgi:hypothetical protein